MLVERRRYIQREKLSFEESLTVKVKVSVESLLPIEKRVSGTHLLEANMFNTLCWICSFNSK